MISQAYQAENLIGSCCTAPLRGYNTWFQNKIEASESGCEYTAWKICHVVSGIFAYLTLGILALVGIAINLCFIPPEDGYSLWARLEGVPGATEEFCEKIRRELSLVCRLNAESNLSGSVSSSTSRQYTYDLNQHLSFDIQDVFEDAPLPLIQADDLPIENDAENERSLRSQTRLHRMEPHIIAIQETIRSLSKKHGWYPENQWIRTINTRATIMIPLPDHVRLTIPDVD